MTAFAPQALDSTPAPRTMGAAGPSGRGARRRGLASRGYIEASLQLKPGPAPGPAPSLHTTASSTLDALTDSDHDPEGLCYLENSIKVRLVLEAHKEALESEDPETHAGEIARLNRLIGALVFAEKLVNGSSAGPAGRRDDAAEAAFPDGSLKEALAEAKTKGSGSLLRPLTTAIASSTDSAQRRS